MILSIFQCALISVPNRGPFSIHPDSLNVSNSITIKYRDKTLKCFDANQHSLRASSLFLLQPYWWFPPIPFMFIIGNDLRYCEEK